MCSLSWYYHQNEYEVFFNRDEKKTRRRATPPALSENNGVRYLSPMDADAGGTWLLVNDHGVTLALLNYWDGMQRPDARFSRGRLLSDQLVHETTAAAVIDRLQNTDLIGYGCFTLAAFDRGLTEGPMVIRWNGACLSTVAPEMPLCSSSYLPDEVISSRQRYFQTLPDHAPETLWHWHSHEESPTAYTVRMNRPDAQTWSISRVTVTADSICWLYVEEMPGLLMPPHRHELTIQK
jgi:hypothetical protein